MALKKKAKDLPHSFKSRIYDKARKSGKSHDEALQIVKKKIMAEGFTEEETDEKLGSFASRRKDKNYSQEKPKSRGRKYPDIIENIEKEIIKETNSFIGNLKKIAERASRIKIIIGH